MEFIACTRKSFLLEFRDFLARITKMIKEVSNTIVRIRAPAPETATVISLAFDIPGIPVDKAMIII